MPKKDCAPGDTGSSGCLPPAPGLPDGAYFEQLSADLSAAGIGTPQILVDLDRLDANADAIVAGVGRERYRIVEKSLPSLELLDYVRNRTGSDRFLVLHLPFLPAILARFPTAQVLVGKPQPLAAVKQFFIGALSPAVFIAAPVLAHFDKLELPFITKVMEATSDQQGFSIYGGGWAAEFVWPEGVALAPFVNDAENENLVPNQSCLVGPPSPAPGPGDWIFQHPRVADALFQFERILLVRGGRLLPESWGAFPRRY